MINEPYFNDIQEESVLEAKFHKLYILYNDNPEKLSNLTKEYHESLEKLKSEDGSIVLEIKACNEQTRVKEVEKKRTKHEENRSSNPRNCTEISLIIDKLLNKPWETDNIIPIINSNYDSIVNFLQLVIRDEKYDNLYNIMSIFKLNNIHLNINKLFKSCVIDQKHLGCQILIHHLKMDTCICTSLCECVVCFVIKSQHHIYLYYILRIFRLVTNSHWLNMSVNSMECHDCLKYYMI